MKQSALTNKISVGTFREETLVVTDELTVGYRVPGMPMVFATPQMIFAMEIVCAASIAPLLPEGSVSVGTHVDVQHLAATAVGATIRSTATVTAIHGQLVTFEVFSYEGTKIIGQGSHTRACVELKRFLSGVNRP
ncbi:MAG: fluoroacetyl-CoA thioesterase [Gammaproteobacteria bacterium]|jgi:fluoroacetyl-CoA thioesterase